MVVWFSPRHGRGAPHPGQLIQDGFDVFLPRDPLPHRDREIAVGASALAEGDVKVEVHRGKVRGCPPGSFTPGRRPGVSRAQYAHSGMRSGWRRNCPATYAHAAGTMFRDIDSMK